MLSVSTVPCVSLLERVAGREGQRDGHAGVLGKNVAVRKMIELDPKIQVSIPPGEEPEAHEILKGEMASRIQAVEEHLRDVRRARRRIREVHVHNARPEERESKQGVHG